MFGAIEAGGTKFLCGIGTGPDDLKSVQIQTATPESMMREAISFFRNSDAPIRAVGIGSFGPVDLNPRSPAFGHITSTPKPGWANCDLAGMIARSLEVPVGFDTAVISGTTDAWST
ncbi:MAG: ROK family protein [Acidobacteriota bacterium]